MEREYVSQPVPKMEQVMRAADGAVASFKLRIALLVFIVLGGGYVATQPWRTLPRQTAPVTEQAPKQEPAVAPPKQVVPTAAKPEPKAAAKAKPKPKAKAKGKKKKGKRKPAPEPFLISPELF